MSPRHLSEHAADGAAQGRQDDGAGPRPITSPRSGRSAALLHQIAVWCQLSSFSKKAAPNCSGDLVTARRGGAREVGECSRSLSDVLKVALELPRVHVKELGERYQVTPPPENRR